MIKKHDSKPIRLFITGGADSGKSHLIKATHPSWTSVLNVLSSDIDKVKVLLIAPTGVAAININGTTRAFQLPKLSSQQKCKLRNKYIHLHAIILDEISMNSNVRLLHVHQQLCEILGVYFDQPFANLSVRVAGDLLQLPPIKQPAKLTECMRRSGDNTFI